jgi:hypothetical protein
MIGNETEAARDLLKVKRPSTMKGHSPGAKIAPSAWMVFTVVLGKGAGSNLPQRHEPPTG